MALTKSKWFLPAVSAAIGAVFAAALWLGDDTEGAAWALAVMIGTGVLLLLGGRFELIRGLRGDGRDEYWARIDLYATALAGIVAISLILGMCVWEWAHGRDGTPYVQLGALTGLAYVVSVALLRWRS